MENNQHSGGQNAASEPSSHKGFSNQQPGQQLPAGTENNRTDDAHPATAEQHSESSKPENENETLGTP